MLRGRTSDTREGATIEGDLSGFKALEALIIAGEGVLALDQEGEPKPYVRWLEALAVLPAEGPRVLTRKARDACVEPRWLHAECETGRAPPRRVLSRSRLPRRERPTARRRALLRSQP